jgi:uncharacterized protein YhaN
VTTIDDKVRERDSLQESLPGLKRKLTQARQDQEIAEDQMKKWTDSWTKAIKPLKLQGEASPAVVNVLLSDMEELFRNVDKAAHDRGRITGIKQDAEHFRTDVRDLVGHIAPDLIELAPEQAVAELHARLTKTQQDAAKLESLEGQIEAKKKLIEETDLIIQAEKMKLDALCQQAGCSDYHDLEDIEKSSQEFQNLRQDVKSLEDQILEQSAGVALEEFIRESGTIDGDAIPGQEEQITRDLTELEQERDELHGTIVEIKVELARMDGNARAAEEADRAQEILAKMRDDVDQYVRLKLGWLILQRQIERYREENEGALINRAGDLFASLTLGSFASLAVDYNDRDDPILQGVRPTGKRVGVEGMSDGTVDPLYLALRLATLERYLENHEPMPFIVDDILIKLDDHRAEATLKVLHGLSHKTQVIFFTHHQRLVELAQNLGADNSIFIHRLS